MSGCVLSESTPPLKEVTTEGSGGFPSAGRDSSSARNCGRGEEAPPEEAPPSEAPPSEAPPSEAPPSEAGESLESSGGERRQKERSGLQRTVQCVEAIGGAVGGAVGEAVGEAIVLGIVLGAAEER
jgi:hypothetical protein